MKSILDISEEGIARFLSLPRDVLESVGYDIRKAAELDEELKRIVVEWELTDG